MSYRLAVNSERLCVLARACHPRIPAVEPESYYKFPNNDKYQIRWRKKRSLHTVYLTARKGCVMLDYYKTIYRPEGPKCFERSTWIDINTLRKFGLLEEVPDVKEVRA